jgi:hypothetical protein
MANITPTKQAYESALETVKKYEKRQRELAYLQQELAYKLSQFSDVKFKVDTKGGEILFSGVLKESSKLLLGQSKCSKEDKFEIVIGKLIAVKNALHEDVEDVARLVEPKPFGGVFPLGNFHTGSLNIY